MEKEPKYVPSTEELKKAEEMMSRKEKKMSNIREQYAKDMGEDLFEGLKKGEYDLKLEKYAVNPSVKAQYAGNFYEAKLQGKIGKHQIDLSVYHNSRKGVTNIWGNIDGQHIEDSLAKELFDKYCVLATINNLDIIEKRADHEIQEEREEEYLKKKKEEQENDPKYIEEKKKKQKELDEKKERESSDREKFRDML